LTHGPLFEPRDPHFDEPSRALFLRFRALGAALDASPAGDVFDRGALRALGDEGLFALAEHDDPTPMFAAFEGLCAGHADNGFLISCVAHAIALRVLSRALPAGADRRWLAPLREARALAAVANAEPHGGTDALSVRTEATRVEGGARVSGRKRSITNAGEADVLLVSAIERAERESALRVYAVDGWSIGLHQRRRTDRVGLMSSPTGDVLARAVFVPSERIIDDGRAVFRECFALERGMVGAMFAAMLRRATVRAARLLAQRPELAAHQWVQGRALDAREALVWVESALYFARARYRSGAPCEAELSTLKARGAELTRAALESVLLLHGARGLSPSLGLERELRDALALSVLGGTLEQHRAVSARSLARET
jgi:alkylation response protein AidB-like acyl-CoA dehydrogenase